MRLFVKLMLHKDKITTPQARPVPPEKPLPTDCCDSGCDVCVFDAYADALDRYKDELARWEADKNDGPG